MGTLADSDPAIAAFTHCLGHAVQKTIKPYRVFSVPSTVIT
jgi:hypothetical protein